MFVTWKKQEEHDNEFEECNKTLNTISNLYQECEELIEKVTFLDLDVNMSRESQIIKA